MEKPTDLSKIRILVVDDDEVQQVIMQQYLQMIGIRDITVVENGQQALSRLQVEKFDLTFTDFNMPVMNGKVLVQTVRSIDALRHTKMVMVTTENDKATLEFLRRNWVHHILKKDVTPGVLKDVLMSLL